ncbi:cell division protein ZapE [Mameliella alba]|jgi:cell division protein ZapE|uniref:cell division protein ZapE n=1 Tax=Mameliella TaxID=1434019 RepID=UPI000841184C|nr:MULTISPECIES: cell division protein ZapE [Mameliella]MCR9275151.1 cell division protein ZapE [Paracoccaceae bacterium]ODM46651.1 ATPase [Ruegeria sp. PBVC088]MDD9731578.1 cell division protein ZapE [Mameliella sp. AT18]OWV42440.1 cell division protein ZapE [Mameliella alba]OWV52391.1 cell division protein ZapE [Mameliella alba]
MATVTDVYQSRVASGKIKPDEAQTAVLPELERLRTDLAQPVKRGFFRKTIEAPQGLYLWGGVGRGKSMLMDLFVDTLDVPARRVHFHAFMQEVQAAIHALRSQGAEDPIKPVAKDISDKVRVLAFDEMQITDIADAMIVGRLFEALFDGGTTVVTTSNRLPDDLYKDGLNRQLFLPFIAFLKERMVVRELASDRDHRQDRLAGAQVFFTPANAEARSQIDALWEELTHGLEETLTLHVKGREVELPRYHNGVARASFFDLCGRMLGPADYLKLAESVRVLIIENIPQLSRRNFNEAKRFVTLIDTLYEARVKLIASAAAQPEMLYVEGEGSFEFERTASRLREMQAAEWST